MLLSINTNGSIYNKSLSSLLKDSDTHIAISIDGPKEIHDKCRMMKNGSPTFDTVASNVEKYLKDGVKLNFSITITEQNINFLPQIAKWIVDKYGGRVGAVGFNPPIEISKHDAEHIDNFRLTMLQMYNAFRILKKHGIYEDRVMRRLKSIITEKPHIKDCAACGNQIVVSPEGMISVCHGFLGTKEFFKSVSADKYNFSDDEIVNKWNMLSPIHKNACSKCPFILLCGNACPYSSMKRTGDIEAPDIRYCNMLPVMVNEVLKDNFYKAPKALFMDYDNTIVLRKIPLFTRLELVSKKFNLKYNVSPYKFYSDEKGVFNTRKFFRINNVNEEKLDEIMKFYLELFYEGAEPNNTLIEQLKKIDLPKYILSNNNEKRISEELKRFGLEGLFAGVYGNSKHPKSSDDFYLDVFSSTKLQPEDVLYIGDSIDDISQIYKFGARVALFAPDKTNEIFKNNWLIELCQT